MNFIKEIGLLFRKEKLDAEMAEEMRHHVELQTELNVKAGMNPGEACSVAERRNRIGERESLIFSLGAGRFPAPAWNHPCQQINGRCLQGCRCLPLGR